MLLGRLNTPALYRPYSDRRVPYKRVQNAVLLVCVSYNFWAFGTSDKFPIQTAVT
jgi:hypothetical protein